MSSDPGVILVIIDGLTNFTGRGVGLAPVRFPLQEASAEAEAPGSYSGNLEASGKFNQQFVFKRDLKTSRVSALVNESIKDEEKSNNATNCSETVNLLDCG
jgi:hypothetical protein